MKALRLVVVLGGVAAGLAGCAAPGTTAKKQPPERPAGQPFVESIQDSVIKVCFDEERTAFTRLRVLAQEQCRGRLEVMGETSRVGCALDVPTAALFRCH